MNQSINQSIPLDLISCHNTIHGGADFRPFDSAVSDVAALPLHRTAALPHCRTAALPHGRSAWLTEAKRYRNTLTKLSQTGGVKAYTPSHTHKGYRRMEGRTDGRTDGP